MNMEKKIIKTGAPFVLAGAAVLAFALLFGIGSVVSYILAALVGVGAFFLGSRMFPVREVYVERGPASGNAEVDAMILEARAQLDEISAANAAIADPGLSAQIEDIESTCRLILSRLEEQPGMVSSLRTFLRYYLPATLKLLSARAKIEGEVHTGSAAQIAGRISEAMGAVQTAFHKQLDALSEYRFINLESEMDVLSDMLKGDGLLDDMNAQEAPAAVNTQENAQQEQEEDPFSGLFAQGGK